MSSTETLSVIASSVASAQQIVVLQADNPDADSLGSALALEHILGDMGKDVTLCCSVDMPGYLKHLEGWDRVQKDLPASFDMTILVDASVVSLIDRLSDATYAGALKHRPFIILDHHATTRDEISFASIAINDPSVSSTGELIYQVAQALKWPVSIEAGERIMSAILGDTQGLTNDLATAETYRIMADLIDSGVSRPKLEEARREMSKMPEPIFRYKADLIKRTELYFNDTIALVTVPQSEINMYSPLYNPSALVHADILQTEGIKIAIVLKHYDSGRVTAAIRANQGAPIAGKLAEQLGGGGHDFASGFKIEDGRPLSEIKSECIRLANDLLQTQSQES